MVEETKRSIGPGRGAVKGGDVVYLALGQLNASKKINAEDSVGLEGQRET